MRLRAAAWAVAEVAALMAVTLAFTGPLWSAWLALAVTVHAALLAWCCPPPRDPLWEAIERSVRQHRVLDRDGERRMLDGLRREDGTSER